jgi:DNA-directed RNA polymerase subunit omega
MKKNDSKYLLIVKIAKRARQLIAGAPPLTKISSNKEVTIAINEIREGKILHVNRSQE